MKKMFTLAFIAAIVIVAACTTTTTRDLSGMTFSQQPLTGKFIWRDLITEDVTAARRFYGGLFGWTFEDTKGPGGRDYVLAKSGNIYVAGMVPVAKPDDGARLSRWLPYMSVADVDGAVAKATAGGGRVAVAARNVNIGRVAAVVDPEGAVLGFVHSNIGDPDDATTAPAPGRAVWMELLSNDPAAATDFYRSIAGYKAETIARHGGQYTIMSASGVNRAGILRNPTEHWDPTWLSYFGVEDPAAAARRAESLGGSILLPVSPKVRDGTLAVVADPSGAVLVLQKLPMQGE
jgi:uncharacterized protein